MFRIRFEFFPLLVFPFFLFLSFFPPCDFHSGCLNNYFEFGFGMDGKELGIDGCVSTPQYKGKNSTGLQLSPAGPEKQDGS